MLTREGGAHWVRQHWPWPPVTSNPIQMAKRSTVMGRDRSWMCAPAPRPLVTHTGLFVWLDALDHKNHKNDSTTDKAVLAQGGYVGRLTDHTGTVQILPDSPPWTCIRTPPRHRPYYEPALGSAECRQVSREISAERQLTVRHGPGLMAHRSPPQESPAGPLRRFSLL